MAPTLNGLLAVWIFTLNIDGAFSMDITVPTDPVYGNMGSSVDLPCKYSTSTIEKGFNVEWRFAAPGTLPINAKRMLYFDGQLYQINSLRGRMQLLQDPPTGGIASVRIIDLQPSDSGVYICEVINPGDWSGTGLGVINLTVLMPPSPPECRVTGNTLVGNDVTLNCHSSQGVPQPIYTWTREKTAAQIPVPEANMVQDQLSGSLLLRNLSYAFNGAFQCQASNEIGAASCTVNIRVSHKLTMKMNQALNDIEWYSVVKVREGQLFLFCNQHVNEWICLIPEDKYNYEYERQHTPSFLISTNHWPIQA
ncbi:UNVERIFIED_CONTAM: hypothetical protein FKN15_040685 [Acipenser sinensis]